MTMVPLYIPLVTVDHVSQLSLIKLSEGFESVSLLLAFAGMLHVITGICHEKCVTILRWRREKGCFEILEIG